MTSSAVVLTHPRDTGSWCCPPPTTYRLPHAASQHGRTGLCILTTVTADPARTAKIRPNVVSKSPRGVCDR
jgi:hypothetical protein